jgi:hypothetical protein
VHHRCITSTALGSNLARQKRAGSTSSRTTTCEQTSSRRDHRHLQAAPAHLRGGLRGGDRRAPCRPAGEGVSITCRSGISAAVRLTARPAGWPLAAVDSGRIARYARSNIVRHYRIEVDKADLEMPTP